MNLYRYCGDSPIVYTDPWGLEEWQDSSGLWWLNPWSYPVARHIINHYAGVYEAKDRGKELEAERKQNDPKKTLTPGDYPTVYSGKSQNVAAAQTESNIKQFGRERIADAGEMVVGGAISKFKFTKNMLSQSEVIAKGRGIAKVKELVKKFGGTTKGWVKKKTLDACGNEVHWYEHSGIGRVGIKPAGTPDPF